jgi:hypothetical protein
MKRSGAAPSIWQPHVAVLLELKQQLASAQSTNGNLNEASAATSNGLQVLNPAEVAQLEAGIAKQVRMPGISYRVEQALSRCM